MLIAYASRTGTQRNLNALRDHEWRLLVSAAGEHRSEGFPYALDNGAYALWQRELAGEPVGWFAPATWAPYVALLDKLGAVPYSLRFSRGATEAWPIEPARRRRSGSCSTCR